MLGKNLLYSILLGFAILSGCATLELSEEDEKFLISVCRDAAENEQCLLAARASMIKKKKVELEYEREDRRIQEEDSIRALVEWCKAQQGMSILYQGPHSVRCDIQNKRHNTPLCIPRFARKYDYQCGDTQEIMKAIQRRMRGGF